LFYIILFLILNTVLNNITSFTRFIKGSTAFCGIAISNPVVCAVDIPQSVRPSVYPSFYQHLHQDKES